MVRINPDDDLADAHQTTDHPEQRSTGQHLVAASWRMAGAMAWLSVDCSVALEGAKVFDVAHADSQFDDVEHGDVSTRIPRRSKQGTSAASRRGIDTRGPHA